MITKQPYINVYDIKDNCIITVHIVNSVNSAADEEEAFDNVEAYLKHVGLWNDNLMMVIHYGKAPKGE